MSRITFYTANGAAHGLVALREAQHALLAQFGGATIQPAHGIWRECDTCAIAEESSLVITVLTDSASDAAKAAHRLREIFAQTEVLYSVEPVTIGHAQA